jgi:ribosomal-protein-alanine acetyltransferase
MTWQLRRATRDDLDPIMSIETTTFGSDAWSTESMRSELGSDNTYYLVASRPGEPARIEGYAGLLAPRASEDADIQTIAVAEGARRKGLGRLLMLSLVNEARKRGARHVLLEVRADNPNARDLYAALGFEQIAVRPGYYKPDNVDAHVMRLTIPEPKTSLAVDL